ncbi:MAG: hypothetical protein ACE5R6_10370 [Candidatus Heimdallarchaeota archaeon]
MDDEATNAAVDFIEKTAGKQGTQVEVAITNKAHGYITDPEHRWVRFFHQTTKKTLNREFYLGGDLGFDDGMYLADVGIPVVTFGALRDDTRYHGHNELVWLEDIRDCRNVFIALGQIPPTNFDF